MNIRIIGVPLDLGASRRGVDMGPSAVRIAQVADRLRSLGHVVEDGGNLVVPDRASLGPVNGPLDYLPAIAEVCEELARRTARAVEDGFAPLVLGGDHSLAAGSVAGAAAAYAASGRRLGLIWLDAHGDLNTPATTLTGNVHGMPVAHLLGHGDPRMAQIARPWPAVRPEHVVQVGIRDLDDAERTHAREWGIHVLTMRAVDERGLRAVMEEAIAIAANGTDGIYVSCDADWVDPDEAPGVGTPVRGGATYREAHLAMEMVADSGRLAGMDLVEINPVLDHFNRTAQLAVELIGSAFGKRIL